MMFSNLEFSDRIKAVKQNGLDAFEFWKWTNKDIQSVCRLKEELGLDFSVFNIDSTDEKLSYDLSRGILNSGRAEELIFALKESIPIYKKLGASGMIVLIGETVDSLSYEEQCENVYKCLAAAAPIAEESGITLVVEPLNDTDRKNYFMPYAAPLFEMLDRVNSPSIKMLYDIYHQNMMGDFSMNDIKKHIGRIGHFHVADCPGRHEPGTGNVKYTDILKEISRLEYDGYIGLEYRATKPDGETLSFLKEIKNV